jgi:hypothetical protein
MPPLSLSVPAAQSDVIAAQVDHRPTFDGDDAPTVRVWIGPNLELVLDLDTADRLADALIDALAVDELGVPVVRPATRAG